jgi:SAM-dependent methyltransferase
MSQRQELESEDSQEIPLDSLDSIGEVDPEFYRNGGNIFSDDELGALGEVAGREVLHLTIGCSEEGPSLVNMGAKVTEVGDDGTTRALAEAAGIAIEFVDDHPAALSAEFCDTRRFDLVYCSFGFLDWVADFMAWAEGVSAVLRPGGRLVLYDEHPFSYLFAGSGDGQLVVERSYFGEYGDDTGGEFDATAAEILEDVEPEDLDPENLVDTTDEEVSESGWTLGDLIGALGANNIAVLDLQEFEESERYETPLDVLGDVVAEDQKARVPGAFLLIGERLAR